MRMEACNYLCKMGSNMGSNVMRGHFDFCKATETSAYLRSKVGAADGRVEYDDAMMRNLLLR